MDVLRYNKTNERQLNIVKIDEQLLVVNKNDLIDKIKEVFNGVVIYERDVSNNYFLKYFLSIKKEEYLSKEVQKKIKKIEQNW